MRATNDYIARSILEDHHMASHHTHKPEHHSKPDTYNAESITTELRRGNTQEAARELNRDLHSSKDFQQIYEKVNQQIDRLNASQHLNLPHMELVDGDGHTADKAHAKGIKVGDTTYGTDTVRNNTTVDKTTGNQTVRTADGDIKNLDAHGNQLVRDSAGHETTIYTEQNKPNDADIGKVKSETRDGQGNRVLEGDNGCKKTIDKDGKETTDFTNGDRKVNRPDGTGCTIHKDADGTTHIHSWSGKTHNGDKDYDVTIKPNGDYTKKKLHDWFSHGGKDYQYQPDEKI
jgi:hypothetical protein